MTDVARERALLAAQGLTMRTREQWGSADPDFYSSDRTVVDPAQAFFWHIAVVNDPSDLIGSEDQVMRNIERIGRARFPNTWYSYDAAVFNGNGLMEGQPLTRRGAHTYNDRERRSCDRAGCPSKGVTFPKGGESGLNLNYTARALCLPQMEADPVTDVQVDLSARWAAAQIRSGLATPNARWHGHRCVSAKACPGDKGWARLPEVQKLTDHYVTVGLGKVPILGAVVTAFPGTYARNMPSTKAKIVGYRGFRSQLLYTKTTTNTAGEQWIRLVSGNYILKSRTNAK
jgi:hypothetical protein